MGKIWGFFKNLLRSGKSPLAASIHFATGFQLAKTFLSWILTPSIPHSDASSTAVKLLRRPTTPTLPQKAPPAPTIATTTSHLPAPTTVATTTPLASPPANNDDITAAPYASTYSVDSYSYYHG